MSYIQAHASYLGVEETYAIQFQITEWFTIDQSKNTNRANKSPQIPDQLLLPQQHLQGNMLISQQHRLNAKYRLKIAGFGNKIRTLKDV